MEGNFDLSHTLRQVYLPTRQLLSTTISALFSMHTHTQAHGRANGGIGILGTRVWRTTLVIISRQHESQLRKGWLK